MTTTNATSGRRKRRAAIESPVNTQASVPDSAESVALAQDAEAEADAAEALAAAASERLRAIRLRRQGDTVNDAEAETQQASPQMGVRRRFHWRKRTFLGVGVCIVVLCASLAATGYMTWQHRAAVEARQRGVEFAAAARQGVVTLTSMDFGHAQADVQRVLDNSTGQFKDEFQRAAGDFTKVVEDSKVVTTGRVTATAVETMSDDYAVVLVTATSEVTNSAGAKKDPRVWRLSVGMTRESGQIKMSRVEFIP